MGYRWFLTPFSADEVWEGLCVLGDVGRDAIVADAVVGEGIGVTVVGDGVLVVHAGLLEADERAHALLLVTPVVWEMVLECG